MSQDRRKDMRKVPHQRRFNPQSEIGNLQSEHPQSKKSDLLFDGLCSTVPWLVEIGNAGA
jgi:hypothetical protein